LLLDLCVTAVTFVIAVTQSKQRRAKMKLAFSTLGCP